jgi:8-oxo-dGTP pyrophosphatase MutT (NUDIX family)
MRPLLPTLRRRLLRGDPIAPGPREGPPGRADSFVVPGRETSPVQKAAVLVPILAHREEPTILFTKRHADLKEHAGQISFPGGRMAAGDANPLETALREAEEEIGLPRNAVSILGALARYRTSTRYDVTPEVGVIAEPFTARPDPREVEAVFEAPVAFFLETDSLRVVTREEQGRRRTFYAYDFRGRLIWGATAAILANLARVLTAYAREGES